MRSSTLETDWSSSLLLLNSIHILFGCEDFTIYWNYMIESHRFVHWNGTEITMDAVSLANSVE